MQAYIYARWSSLEQSKGSTLHRQTEACDAFAKGKGWEIVESLSDRGKSAYTGDNIETGNLGRFAQRIHARAINPTETVLIVEELDRLSRQPADVMLTWLSPLVRAGLTVAVVNSGQIITRDMLDHDMGGLMMILITAFGSHTESRKKATRVGAAWAKKRADAREGKAVTLAHRHPKWIEIGPDGTFVVPPAKRFIVEMIFRNRIDGIGKGLTAKRLNELAQTDSAFAPWAGSTVAQPEMWTATYVGRVLSNRAVMGEWQPWHRPRKGAATPAGDPVKNYYPAIISAADFARANAARLADALKHQGRGTGLSNLLGTKARCGLCGGQMAARGSSTLRINRDGSRSRHYFLYCQDAKSGGTCENQTGWTYDRVEQPILDTILDVAMSAQHFGGGTDTAPLEAAVYAARGEVAEIDFALKQLLPLLTKGVRGIAEEYERRAADHAVAEEALADAEARLEEARGHVAPAEHIRRVQEVRAMMDSPDVDERFQARSRVKAALNDIIKEITFYPPYEARRGPVEAAVMVEVIDKMRVFTIDKSGKVSGDLNLRQMRPNDFGPDGYGVVTVREGGVTRYENVLDADQRAAAAAYRQREDKALATDE